MRILYVYSYINRVIECSRENGVQLNAKELRISFAKEQRVFDPVIIEGKEVELVTSTKLLGLTIANDLTWNDHVTEITKKASKRLYFLTQLKRAGVPKQDLALFYVSCVRSVIDYAAPVFFNGLPQYLEKELVRLGIIGVGVPPGSANPDPISDHKMSFSHPFSDLAAKKLYFIITWIRTGKKC